MNQGKLEVVKQEMTRVNIDILGISELRWTGWVSLLSKVLLPRMLLEISGEITPERMKAWSQSKNNTQLWM